MNNWTPDRPTKPGKYELSIHPDKRPQGFRSRMEVEVSLYPRWMLEPCGKDFAETVLAVAHGFNALPRCELADPFFDGAQWLPYVEPPDPFAEPVPSLRERVEALPRFDPAAPDSRMLPHMQPTADGLFLARSDVLALFEVPR